MTKRGSLKMKVGLYAALLTILALITGAVVVLPSVHHHQIAQLDETLESDARELVRDLQNFRGAPLDPRRPLSAKFIPLALRGRYLIVEGPEGQVLYKSPNLRGTTLDSGVGAETRELFGRNCRLVTVSEGPYLIHIGTRLGTIERFQRDLLRGFALSVPFVALVVFVGGWWLGRRAVAPVAAITAAAETITAENLGERLPMPRAKDEIARLTTVLNHTFDRLQSSYEAATRFSADASHQLKTPVAVLRAGLDSLAATADPALAPDIEALRQQTRRLTALIEDLLLLAQADAGRLALEAATLDLAPLAEAAADDLGVLTHNRDIHVETNIASGLTARADARRIKLILQNLVENAAKYTPVDGTIRITAHIVDDSIHVVVANSGALIPEDDRATIFERFRRGSRVGENIRGHGLGLNIARELARAHGGDLDYEPSPDGLNAFTLRLPRG
ncbi:MAG: HAMP domain-containing histidine kinase [Akkermansiaceae bacterium]|nr:HAMP domain-containing histidine kinase [Akkermansiaceae bacterium]MCP5547839.1 HAMP domain-containing histidine kinase [Akkermansiaceae bacterium]